MQGFIANLSFSDQAELRNYTAECMHFTDTICLRGSAGIT